MWELEQSRVDNLERLNLLLQEGYEPFAVTTDSYHFAIIWLKREITNEVHSQSAKPIKRTGTRATRKT